MLHALALIASLLVLFLSFRQMARDIVRYVLSAPPSEHKPVTVRLMRRGTPMFNPVAVPVAAMRRPRAVRLAA